MIANTSDCSRWEVFLVTCLQHEGCARLSYTCVPVNGVPQQLGHNVQCIDQHVQVAMIATAVCNPEVTLLTANFALH